MNLTDPSTLCLLVLVGAIVFLLIRTRSQFARQRQRWAEEESEAHDPGAAQTRASLPDGLADDLSCWEVEMHETVRQYSAQLDAKLGLLQSLIAEADRAAERLEDALGRVHPSLPPGSQAESLRPGAGSARDARPETEPAAAASPSASDQESPRAADRARRRDEVYHLADYGFAAAEIARRVDMPVGEVELILGLRESKG